MCSEKESPNELWVCYLVFVQSRNLSDERLSFCLYMFIHVYLLLCLCIVYFIDLTFQSFIESASICIVSQLLYLSTNNIFFLVWGGGLNLRNMGIKCLRIEKCVLCAHIRVNLKEPPSKSMIFENAVVQSILHVVMISV